MKQETIRAQAEPASVAEAVPPLDTIIGYKLRRAQLAVFQDFAESFSRMKLRPADALVSQDTAAFIQANRMERGS